MSASTPPRAKRHAIRGLVSGLVFGLGLILLLITLGFAAFTSIVPFVLILAASTVAGLGVGLYRPGTSRQS